MPHTITYHTAHGDTYDYYLYRSPLVECVSQRRHPPFSRIYLHPVSLDLRSPLHLRKKGMCKPGGYFDQAPWADGLAGLRPTHVDCLRGLGDSSHTASSVASLLTLQRL